MTRVKFCGLRTAEDAAAASRLMPDFAGFVLSAGFRRSITEEQAAKVREHLAPGIRTVGVFVDEKYREAANKTVEALTNLALAIEDGELSSVEVNANIEVINSCIDAWKAVK